MSEKPPIDMVIESVLVQATGLDKGTLKSALKGIHAPDSFIGIENIAEKIHICHQVNTGPVHKPVAEMDVLVPIADAIGNHQAAISDMVGRPLLTANNHLRGLCEDHPLWAMLIGTDLQLTGGTQMVNLVLDVLALIPRIHAGNWKRVVIATRWIRIASEQSHLVTLPPLTASPEETITRLRAELDDSKDEKLVDLYRALKAIVEGVPDKQSGSGGGNSGGNRRIRGVVNSVDRLAEKLAKCGEFDSDSGITVLTNRNLTTTFSPSGDYCDVTPSEMIFSQPEGSILDDEPPQTEASFKSTVGDQLAQLQVSPSSMSPGTIARCLVRLIDTLEHDADRDTAAAALLLSLLHGLTTHQLARLKDAGHSDPDMPELAIDRVHLHIPTLGLEFFHSPADEWKHLLNPVEPSLAVPLAAPLAQWLADSSENLGRLLDFVSKHSKEGRHLRANIKAGFNSICGDCGLDASPGRLAYAYRNALYRQGADYADVVLLCGQADRDLLWSVTYTLRSSAALLDFHRAVYAELEDLTKQVGDARNIQAQESGSPPVQVGSCRVPTEKVLIDTVQRLAAALRASLGESHVARHNLVAATVYFVLGLATGSRPTLSRFARRTDFSDDLSQVFISDKDDEHFTNARVLILPPIARRMLERFLDSRNKSVDELTCLAPRTAEVDRVAVFSETFSDADREAEAKARGNVPGLIFLIDEDLRPYTAEPNRVGRILMPYFELHAYTLRHYIRSEARRQGLPATVINHALGHWGIAECPYATPATIPTAVLAHQFSEFTEKLLTRLGVTTLEKLI